MTADPFAASAACGVRWSVLAVPLPAGEPLRSRDADLVLPSASTAKVLALLTAADDIEHGDLDPEEPLDRREVAPVHDSGVWQHLAVDRLVVDDVARLVGVTSDNLATNVLLGRLGGVGRVRARAVRFAVDEVALHDIVRDERAPADPPTLSTGSARGYTRLFTRLWTDDGIPPAVASRVRGWLAGGMDLSMVASAFGLDPLAHEASDRGFALVNKTGTDAGIRADAGVVSGPSGSVAYACLAEWTPAGMSDPRRDDVLAAMREFGHELRRAVA